MKFAHLADCHLGSWREPKLRELNAQAFEKAIEMCISEKVDFVIVSGDLFNTSIPSIESLRHTVVILKKLKDLDMPVYMIAGSHDFSPSGKTMLDVLEQAGLLKNVAKADDEDGKLKLKFTVDRKTGAKITGMIGKKGMLEKSYFESLDKKNLENETGFKIFMFHTALDELKTKELEKMDSAPISLLPKLFDYYAAGHVHVRMEKSLPGYKNVIYPGPLFPNNFSELEKGTGGFYIFNDSKIRFMPVNVINVHSIEIDCSHKVPEQITSDILAEIKNKEFLDTIVLIRLFGILESGKPSEINFKEIFNQLNEKSAYFAMKNTNKLEAKEFEEIKVSSHNIEQIESNLIKENSGQIEIDLPEEKLVKSLMQVINTEKEEGELNRDFEERLKKEMDKIFDL
jgi:DNA repair exonuclease SbcCD nuclease subunit